MDESRIPLREAWDRALYADCGFYRRSLPSEHFRTSVHAGAMFAAGLVALARRIGVTRVIDVGAGGGELLSQLLELDTGLELVAVELRPRPAGLSSAIEWLSEVPTAVDGLLIANEVVDNVACDVVELDEHDVVRLLEVDVTTGAEHPGDEAPPEVAAWLERWWPLDQPGARAEVGLARERWWADVVGRVRTGAALAIDYGHVAGARPPLGSLASYRDGRAVSVGFAGDRDVTADVAFDALRECVGGTLDRQADWLPALGISTHRPRLDLAQTDPAAYVRQLSQLGEIAELTSSPGLGDFWWLLSGPGRTDVAMGT